MSTAPGNGDRRLPPRATLRIGLVLLGVAGLLAKRHYTGPFQDLVFSYGGNAAVSFAVYFIVGVSSLGARLGPAWSAGAALLAVEAFEWTDGFGVMSNTYDPLDLVANAVGVGAGWALDRLLSARGTRAAL
jgi:hypothetical protein